MSMSMAWAVAADRSIGGADLMVLLFFYCCGFGFEREMRAWRYVGYYYYRRYINEKSMVSSLLGQHRNLVLVEV